MKTSTFATALERGKESANRAHACGLVSRMIVSREGASPSSCFSVRSVASTAFMLASTSSQDKRDICWGFVQGVKKTSGCMCVATNADSSCQASSGSIPTSPNLLHTSVRNAGCRNSVVNTEKAHHGTVCLFLTVRRRCADRRSEARCSVIVIPLRAPSFNRSGVHPAWLNAKGLSDSGLTCFANSLPSLDSSFFTLRSCGVGCFGRYPTVNNCSRVALLFPRFSLIFVQSRIVNRGI